MKNDTNSNQGTLALLHRSTLLTGIAALGAAFALGCSADVANGPNGPSGDGPMQGEFTGAEAYGELSQHLDLPPTGATADTPEDIEAARLDMAPPTGPLPASVDLSNKTPPVGNQGGQGSCVGWATAYAAQSYLEKVEWDWSVDLTRYQFSPSWIYNQINNGVDNGTTVSKALNLLVDRGADTLAFFPYSQSNFTTQPTAASFSRAARFKATSWNTLVNNATTLKQVLAAGNVIVARFEVLPDWDQMSASNPVFDNTSGSSRGGHAVAIVGYDDARSAFKVQNSWGQGFAFDGFGWFGYSTITAPSVKFAAYVLNNKKDAAPAASPNLYAVQAAKLLRVDKEFGDWSQTGSGDWTGATSGAALNGSLYIIQSGKLLKSTTAGNWSQLGTGDWSGSTEMAALDGKLYAIQAGQLLLVNTTTGAWTRVGTASWTSSAAMVGVGGKLFIIRSGTLYRVDPTNGAATSLGTGWGGPVGLAAVNGGLYAVQSDQLLSVNQTNGAWSRLGTGLYQNVTAMSAINGKLYVIHDGNLVMADTAGNWQVLGARGAWVATSVLMSNG